MNSGSVEREFPPVRDKVLFVRERQIREPAFGRVCSTANRQTSLNATRPAYFAEVPS
jgi:hypothetical protein